MNLALIVYLIGVLSTEGHLFGWGIALCAFITCIRIVAITNVYGASSSYKEEAKELLNSISKITKPILITSVVMVIYGFFMPSKETAYTMLAAYGVETAVTNPNVQRVASKSLEVLESYMDEYQKSKKEPSKQP